MVRSRAASETVPVISPCRTLAFVIGREHLDQLTGLGEHDHRLALEVAAVGHEGVELGGRVGQDQVFLVAEHRVPVGVDRG